MKKIYLVLYVLLSLNAAAQDVHFSQYFNSPLTASPANTGNFKGDWRISSNYRSQWKQIDKPYLTQSLGYDRQLYLFSNKISVGGILVNDRSSATLKVLKLLASVGYEVQLASGTIHTGLQGGFVRKQIDPLAETYPNQFNWGSGQFDNTIPSYETNLSESLGYLDLNLGAGYDFHAGRFNPFVYGSIFHLNHPSESFFGTDRLKARKVLNVGTKVKLTKKLGMQPSVLISSHSKASELLAGSLVSYIIDPNEITFVDVYGGVFWRDGLKRNTDSFFATIGMNYKRCNVGLSYDLNSSPLHAYTNYKGAFEIAFIYTGLSTRLTKIEVPCERY